MGFIVVRLSEHACKRFEQRLEFATSYVSLQESIASRALSAQRGVFRVKSLENSPKACAGRAT
jgi:hypothetical protein